MYALFVFYAPNMLGNPDNYTPANPLVTPPDIVPEWYLLPFYAMLRSIPQKLIGVLVLFGAMAHARLHALARYVESALLPLPPDDEVFFWVFVVDCMLLGYCGSQSVDAAWNLGRHRVPLVWVARLGTLYYFGFFWLLMPLVGLIETPKPLPASIATAVLAPAE
jgi:ubiquinol-cytochrome c reductase cytochrome b/c1 subunit